MSRVYRYTVVFIVYLVSAVIHLVSSAIFAPDMGLYEEVANSGSTLPGAEWAQLYYEVGSMWVPMIAVGGITLWLLYMEYRRIVATRQVRPP